MSWPDFLLGFEVTLVVLALATLLFVLLSRLFAPPRIVR